MTYTRHGHHIAGTPRTDWSGIVARCGGPGVCILCAKDAAATGVEGSEAGMLDRDMCALIDKYNLGGPSGAPNFALAEYLFSCLRAFNATTKNIRTWYGPTKDIIPNMPNSRPLSALAKEQNGS